MPVHDAVVEALAAGEAFLDLSGWRVTALTGSDARPWLQSLITASIDDLVPGRARASLVLSRTGSVLAGFTVASVDEGFLLIQDPEQPRPVAELLDRYVLSSDVHLDDRTDVFAIMALPGAGSAPGIDGVRTSTPSCIGAEGGLDLIADAGERDRVVAALAGTASLADPDDGRAWRIAAAIPVVGVDTGEGDLPAECRLDEAVDPDKGCFVGQEAVARARNLGHPRRVLLPVEAPEGFEGGERVTALGEDAGRITSATPAGGRTIGLASVRWSQREADLRTASGVELARRTPIGGEAGS